MCRRLNFRDFLDGVGVDPTAVGGGWKEKEGKADGELGWRRL